MCIKIFRIVVPTDREKFFEIPNEIELIDIVKTL